MVCVEYPKTVWLFGSSHIPENQCHLKLTSSTWIDTLEQKIRRCGCHISIVFKATPKRQSVTGCRGAQVALDWGGRRHRRLGRRWGGRLGRTGGLCIWVSRRQQLLLQEKGKAVEGAGEGRGGGSREEGGGKVVPVSPLSLSLLYLLAKLQSHFSSTD
jgi:hypothetical protein